MSKTIDAVPEYLTREQYLGFFAELGIDPAHTVELRAAADGVHALVFALDEHGNRILDLRSPDNPGYQKHRLFIPVRRDDGGDDRTTTVTMVGGAR